jgi:predicted RNA binding protein YcfA (HicA-like mRNA interferase family)
MSTRLPVVGGARLVRALQGDGWTAVRQRGSHVRLERDGRHLSVPMHDPLKRGLLAQILDDAGMTVDDLRRLL